MRDALATMLGAPRFDLNTQIYGTVTSSPTQTTVFRDENTVTAYVAKRMMHFDTAVPFRQEAAKSGGIMEHRWGNRVATNINVRLIGCPPSVGWGCLRDVSVSGGFIETQLPLRSLSLLRVCLPGRNHSVSDMHTLQAMVVRHQPGGVGVEWLDPGDEAIERLVRTIEAGGHVHPTARLMAGNDLTRL